MLESKIIQTVKDHKLLLFFIFSIGFTISMFIIGELEREREFYDQRAFFRENWDCETIEFMLEPTGKWGEGEREYLNSLWIVKECWLE